MSRRWRDPLVSRRRRLEAPWIPLVQAAPQLPPQSLTTKRRVPAPRRIRAAFLPPVSAPQPTFPTRPRRPAVRVRRGRMFETPWVATVVAAPSLVPGTLDPARRKLPVRVRRGGFLPFPWPQQTPVTPPFVADPVQRPVRVVVVRKGRFAAPPWPQQSAAPQFIPDMLQRPVRVVVVRRGRFALPPWLQQTAAAPVLPLSLTQQNPVCARPFRRGRFLPGPLAQDPPQRTLRQTVRRPAPVRRGRVSQPLTIVSLAGPGPIAPKLTRPATRRLVIPRRGRFLVVPLDGAAPATPGFVCQDFTTVAVVDAYSGVATVDAYAATRTVDAYAGSFSVDAYTGSATNCGR